MMILLVKATLVLTIALVCVWLARRSRAAVRHAVLAGAFATLAALPVLGMLSPAVNLPLPVRTVPSFEGMTFAPEPSVSPAAAVARNEAVPNVDWVRRGALVAWVTGTLLALLPVLVGVSQARRLRQGGIRFDTAERAAAALAKTAGITRSVAVLRHREAPGPLTFGVFQSTILLPIDATEWSDGDIRRALIHELEHVRRFDWLLTCLVRSICAMYWCHPLVWIAWRQFALEAERACDDAVLARDEAGADVYAEQLLHLAERLASVRRQPQLAMANRRDLSRRVSRVLDAAQSRGRTSRTMLTGVAVTTVALMLGLGLLRPTARAQALQPPAAAQDSSQPRFDVVSIRLNASGSKAGGSRINPGGGFSAQNENVRELIQLAYGIEPPQLRGAPGWVASNGYDIEARPTAPTAPEGTLSMLRTLLADRFHLKAHWENEHVQGFALSVARGGPKLKAAIDCQGSLCGGAELSLDGRLVARKVSIAQLLPRLSRIVGRPIIDQTRVDGEFDIDLEWAPESGQLGGRSAERAGDTRPVLPTALTEQLGLKLEPANVLRQVLVIDSIALPSE
jgi:bla regulator protein blaR1